MINLHLIVLRLWRWFGQHHRLQLAHCNRPCADFASVHQSLEDVGSLEALKLDIGDVGHPREAGKVEADHLAELAANKVHIVFVQSSRKVADTNTGRVFQFIAFLFPRHLLRVLVLLRLGRVTPMEKG